jgi:hypothetical protein
MNPLREFIATLFFIVAIVLTIYLCTNQFHWGYLFIAIGCYIAAYWIWPSKKDGQRADDYWWLDILELFIELPFRLIGWLLRALKNKDTPDIDV